ncbi:hypothetical protein QLX67_13120 [Balneolaceae bacterium ANBcel3]|nr:hypothetical protein [Balneolaceae bacterium ANBcel3]
MNESSWDNLKLSEDAIVRRKIGPVTLFLKKVLNEVWTTSVYSDHVKKQPESLPEKPEWNRVALPEDCDEVHIRPVFPDKPVVIDTEYPYRIAVKTVSHVFCRIPAVIRITPVFDQSLLIAEIPTTELSLTWFGSPTEGELSFALSSTARRSLSADLLLPHLIVCPIHIHNKSEDELQFAKINLRVEKLSIFHVDDTLWADETNITYLGKDSQSEVEIKAVLPDEAKGAELLSNPRNPAKKSLAVRSFKLLRDFNLGSF